MICRKNIRISVFSEPTEEYPFEEGQAFYAGDSYASRISAMSTFAKVHPMLRAYGEDLGDMSSMQTESFALRSAMKIVAPKPEYKVYRCPEDEEIADGNLIATTSDLSWFDTEGEKGKYRYAVVASYPVGDSEAIYSNLVELSSVETVVADGVAIRYDSAACLLSISGSEGVNEITIVNLSGAVVFSQSFPGSEVELNSLPSDMYIIAVTLSDGSIKSYKIVKR